MLHPEAMLFNKSFCFWIAPEAMLHPDAMLFEGVSSTTVILAPGVCRRGAVSSTFCDEFHGA